MPRNHEERKPRDEHLLSPSRQAPAGPRVRGAGPRRRDAGHRPRVARRPVIFDQERPGLGGRTFWFHKFRTMTFERDSAGELRNVGSISVGPKSSQSGSSVGRSCDVAEIINVERSAVIATRVDGLRVGTLD
jgi:hypothetical protein